jgi:HlyD family secretion protein
MRRWEFMAGFSFDEQPRRPVSRLMPALLIVASAWWAASAIAVAQTAETSASGRVEGGSDILSLGTSATGTIAQLLVEPGARVQAGQVLVRVECRNIERELEARKSDLAAAEAVYLRTLLEPRPEEISIGIANVNLAEARLQEAEKSLQRTQLLHEGFTVTRVQIDLAQRDARIAAALVDEVRAKLALLKAGSREEDVTEARARRDAAKGRVDEAATRLGYCSVEAPIGGIVLSTNVNPGQFVSAFVPVTLLTMVDDNRRRVRAFVDERDTAKLCLRQRTRIAAEGIPAIDGVIENIGVATGENPFAANAARQFRPVMLSVPDNQQQIPIGLRVSVQFLPCPPAQKGPGK